MSISKFGIDPTLIRSNSKSAPGKAKMEESGKGKISCSCKPCGKGPFGSVEEADAHYKTGKHRGKSAVFTRLEGAEKVNRCPFAKFCFEFI